MTNYDPDPLTRTLPTRPGFYWVWSKGFPCDDEIFCVKVRRAQCNGRDILLAWVPKMDYEEEVTRAHGEWADCLWSRHYNPPELPAVDS